MREINDSGFNLIKNFEGCRLSAYQDVKGIWTIGYGHIKGVQPGQNITQEQAEQFLRDDLKIAAYWVSQLVPVPLTDNEFSALVSIVFNCGPSPLQATLGRKLKAGDFQGAADEFLKWHFAGGKPIQGLADRRECERALFLRKD